MIDSAFEAARQICRRHAKSFYFASHFLPESKRRHAYAVYAFCRLLDDAVDEAAPSQMQIQLERFESLLQNCYDGRWPTDGSESSLALWAFSTTVSQCRIPIERFRELADGCRMDLTINRYADWPALEQYCYHVAGVVGLIMCHVFEVNDESAHRQAIAMGNAMQLTNILRDIDEDCQRGRIYLPQDEMRQFDVSDEDLQERRGTSQLKSLVRFQISRARALYDQGARGLHAIPSDGSRQTAAVMACVYSGILGAIERLDCDIFRERARLTLFQKLARLPRAFRLADLRGDSPDPRAFE